MDTSTPASGPPVLVNWSAAVTTLHALARLAAPDATPMLEPLARHLLTPLCRLEELNRLASRAAIGDERATTELNRLSSLGHSRLATRGLFKQFCADADSRRVDFGDAHPAAPEATHGTPALDAADVLQEAGLVELMLLIAGAGTASPHLRQEAALDWMVSLVGAAGSIGQLTRAYQGKVLAGLLDGLRELAGFGYMQTLSDMPDMRTPSLPDDSVFPDIDAELDFPAWPASLKPIHDIIAELRHPRYWDREYWRPFSPLEREPAIDYPPGWLELLTCTREVARRLKARAELPPPPRPPLTTWASGITGIEQDAYCTGDRIIIRGAGFAAIRATSVLMLPFQDGCRPVDITDVDWTDTTITVSLPPDVVSGPIGFADAAYIGAYAAWMAEQDRLLQEIQRFSCYPLFTPAPMASPFRDCPPDHGVNHLRAGAALIKAFTVNGLPAAFVEPHTTLVLDWSVVNAESIELKRSGSSGPSFSGSSSVLNPSGQSLVLGPFDGDTPRSERYTLVATGPCGKAEATVEVRLCKVPTLTITGIEVTQGIQKFRSPDGADNDIALVKGKDTVVRVYVTANGLEGFKLNWATPDTAAITGELRVGGYTLAPMNGSSATAEPDVPSRRARSNATLNFRLPAALAEGTKILRIRAWTVDELPSSPAGELVRPATPFSKHSAVWHDKLPFRVRYVRVSQPGRPALSDQQAREVVLRAFHLLATPPLDIAPARIPIWHTGENLSTRQGISNLLGHIDDQHDCTLSEALFFWEDSCPDDDGAVWVAVTPRSDWGGMAQGLHWFNASRNSAVVPPDPIVAAHELGHTLKLNHVKVGGFDDEDQAFDSLPNGGAIRCEDAFDPFSMKTLLDGVSGFAGLYDFMSYASLRWVSPENWKRVFNKF